MPEKILDPIIGNSRDQELLRRAEYGVYTNSPEGDLAAYCYRPEREISSVAPSPAIVFFHGGKFDQRLVAQFAPHALHFSSRGIIAYIVEYRVKSINGTGPMEALEDARTFIKYLMDNQEHFSVDLDRLILGGMSSGGMLALHLASRHKKNLQYTAELPKPKGLILYAPLSDTTSKGLCSDLFPDEKIAKTLSPSEQQMKGAPPLLIFHGKADKSIPITQSEKLVKGWKRKKNQAELSVFETARHIDFNLNVNPQYYELSIRTADHFLVELGILEPDPDAFID